MAEHTYLTEHEKGMIRADYANDAGAIPVLIMRLLDDLEAMRSVYREKNPCGHYKRFQIVDTDPESACAACEIDRICREYSDLEAQLEAMRAEREKDNADWGEVVAEQNRTLLNRKNEINALDAELDRLRKVLVKNWQKSRKDTFGRPYIHCAYCAGQKADGLNFNPKTNRYDFPHTAGCMVIEAERALNPQAPSTEQNKPLARIPTPNVDAMFERAAQLADELVPDEEE